MAAPNPLSKMWQAIEGFEKVTKQIAAEGKNDAERAAQAEAAGFVDIKQTLAQEVFKARQAITREQLLAPYLAALETQINTVAPAMTPEENRIIVNKLKTVLTNNPVKDIEAKWSETLTALKTDLLQAEKKDMQAAQEKYEQAKENAEVKPEEAKAEAERAEAKAEAEKAEAKAEWESKKNAYEEREKKISTVFANLKHETLFNSEPLKKAELLTEKTIIDKNFALYQKAAELQIAGKMLDNTKTYSPFLPETEEDKQRKANAKDVLINIEWAEKQLREEMWMLASRDYKEVNYFHNDNLKNVTFKYDPKQKAWSTKIELSGLRGFFIGEPSDEQKLQTFDALLNLVQRSFIAQNIPLTGIEIALEPKKKKNSPFGGPPEGYFSESEVRLLNNALHAARDKGRILGFDATLDSTTIATLQKTAEHAGAKSRLAEQINDLLAYNKPADIPDHLKGHPAADSVPPVVPAPVPPVAGAPAAAVDPAAAVVPPEEKKEEKEEKELSPPSSHRPSVK